MIDEYSTWRNQTLLSLELKSNKVNQHPLYLFPSSEADGEKMLYEGRAWCRCNLYVS